jgi:hypothetical protein
MERWCHAAGEVVGRRVASALLIENPEIDETPVA